MSTNESIVARRLFMSGADLGVVDRREPVGEIADLHGRGIRDVDAPDLGRSRALVEARAAAVGARRELHRAVDEGPDVRLQRVPVLLQHRLRQLGDEPLVGHVDGLDLDLRRLLVEEVLHLLVGVVLDRLVRVDEARLGESLHHPAVDVVAGDRERTVGQRLGAVEELVEVDVARLARDPRSAGTCLR